MTDQLAELAAIHGARMTHLRDDADAQFYTLYNVMEELCERLDAACHALDRERPKIHAALYICDEGRQSLRDAMQKADALRARPKFNKS